MKSVLKSRSPILVAASAVLSVGLFATTRAAESTTKPATSAKSAEALKATETKKQPETKPAEAAKKAAGTVAGNVLGTDGKTAAAGAKIRLLAAADAKPRKQADPAAAKPGKVPAVAETEVDADGAFTLGDVPPGEYVVVARLKGEGNARQKVTVAAGEGVKVALTLKTPAAAK